MIHVKNLSKTYKIPLKKAGVAGAVRSVFKREYRLIKALDEISFSIGKGELIGYIGPNGAGKSTTIKILSGILVPDGGECVIDGFVPWKQRKKYVREIGVVFGQRTQLCWDLPVRDSYELLRDIYSIPAAQYRQSLDEMTEMLDLVPLMDVPVRQLSLGQRMRCDIAASLLHRPRLLFLDEPTIGLDAVAKFAIRDFITEINKKEKVTIILTTHDMDDIEALASRIIVIGTGKIIFDGAMQELRASIPAHRHLILDFNKSDELREFSENIKDRKNITIVSAEGTRAVISFDPVKVKPQDLVKTISDNYNFADIAIEYPPIEELIARLYSEMKT